MKSSLLPVLLSCLTSLSACAQSPPPEAAADAASATPAAAPKVAPGSAQARALATIRSLSAQAQVDRIVPAPLPGFQEVVVGGQVIYVSDDGRYLLQGSLYDAVEQKDLTQAGLAQVRRDLLRTVPKKDRIVFPAASPKYTVSVFTDVECGYCRKLHQDIAEYNSRGITIEYLAFPRMGLGSEDHTKMVSVWCASDRRKALTDAKHGRPVPTKSCTNPVTMQYDIGQRVGLTGTPMIITAEGVQMPGYMPPDALLAALDKLAADGGPAPAGTGGAR
jgi:thiol:disulfide interchange protein DsbC